MKKFKIITLGCRTNQYESQAWRDQLEILGFEAAKEEEDAEVCIINTCTVTSGADRDSLSQIKRVALKNKGSSRVVVTGCYAGSGNMPAIEGVTDIVLNQDKEDLVQKVFPELEVPEFNIRQMEAHTRAFVKVQDGCNSFCTYCIIPYVRGRSRSRSIAGVVKEVEGLVKNGYKEVVLTGINIGDFDGGDGKARLHELVEAVDSVPGLRRLRLSSIDPDEVDEELTRALLEGKNTCPSLHIVLQSGSDAVLKRMNRKYTRAMFLQTVEKLQKQRPGFGFTTDIIVGFPGETEKDFQDTLEIVQKVRFAKVHMFPYSVRSRTRAALFPNRVSPSEIKARKTELIRVAEKSAFDWRQEFVGSRAFVLVENNQGKGGHSMGHTDNFLPVAISGHVAANEIVQVIFTENHPAHLIGQVLS